MYGGSLFGPFKNPDDVNRYWYKVTEEELEKDIEEAGGELKTPNISKESKRAYEEQFKGSTGELKNLRGVVEDFVRCFERYKFDRKALQQVQEDWLEYNHSLYSDWSRTQQMILDSRNTEGERLKVIRAQTRAEKIRREEIEKRIKDLLSGG